MAEFSETRASQTQSTPPPTHQPVGSENLVEPTDLDNKSTSIGQSSLGTTATDSTTSTPPIAQNHQISHTDAKGKMKQVGKAVVKAAGGPANLACLGGGGALGALGLLAIILTPATFGISFFIGAALIAGGGLLFGMGVPDPFEGKGQPTPGAPGAPTPDPAKKLQDLEKHSAVLEAKLQSHHEELEGVTEERAKLEELMQSYINDGGNPEDETYKSYERQLGDLAVKESVINQNIADKEKELAQTKNEIAAAKGEGVPPETLASNKQHEMEHTLSSALEGRKALLEEQKATLALLTKGDSSFAAKAQEIEAMPEGEEKNVAGMKLEAMKTRHQHAITHLNSGIANNTALIAGLETAQADHHAIMAKIADLKPYLAAADTLKQTDQEYKEELARLEGDIHGLTETIGTYRAVEEAIIRDPTSIATEERLLIRNAKVALPLKEKAKADLEEQISKNKAQLDTVNKEIVMFIDKQINELETRHADAQAKSTQGPDKAEYAILADELGKGLKAAGELRNLVTSGTAAAPASSAIEETSAADTESTSKGKRSSRVEELMAKQLEEELTPNEIKELENS